MNYRLLYAWTMTLMLAVLIGCSSDEPENNGTTAKPVPAASTLTMTIVTDQTGSGNGTAAQPFTATSKLPLNATLSQTVTYIDANGQQQTVNPKATIAVAVKSDSIHAADLAALTKLTEPSPKTDMKAGNPQTATHQQVFDIGGQQIAFDLSYEIYSYTNGSNHQTELPYVELKAPKYGAATPDEVSTTRAVQGFGQTPVASVTAIRLTPIKSITRSTTVRDTTMYDVAVSFTVEAATHNVSPGSTQTLSFDVHYTASVDNITEVPNASTSIDYQLNYHGGTSDTKSPFNFSAKDQLQLEWCADARCTYTAMEDLSTRVVTMEPKAAITVSLKSDTVRWGDDKENLSVVSSTEPIVTTFGQQPQETDFVQTFTIGGQTIKISWKYEDYGSVVVEDTTVAMPYLLLDAPELVEVMVAETAQSRKFKSRLGGKTYTMREGQTRVDDESNIGNLQGGTAYYEVTARFRQQLKGMNTQEPVAETIEYVVKYIAEIGMKLINTTYEKGYEWLEPWCDLPWRYNYIVWRVRTYSNGKTEKDEFRLPTGAYVSVWSSVANIPECSPPFIYHNLNYDVKNDDFRFILTTKTGVPDINLLSWSTYEENRGNTLDFSQYVMIHSDKLFNPTAPEENWYGQGIAVSNFLEMKYASTGEEHENEKYDLPDICFIDYFLYLDGQIIDFPEYRMTYNCSINVEDINFDGAPAKVFTNVIKAKYLGKDFYAATVDTVYQIK